MINLINERGKEYGILRSFITKDEVPSIEIVEHRLGGARMFEPAHAFATNYRIIIIRGGIFKFQQSYKIINYSNITEVKLERNFLFNFSRLHFSLQSESPEDSKKWLVGIKYGDALEMIRFVNEIKQKSEEGRTPAT